MTIDSILESCERRCFAVVYRQPPHPWDYLDNSGAAEGFPCRNLSLAEALASLDQWNSACREHDARTGTTSIHQFTVATVSPSGDLLPISGDFAP